MNREHRETMERLLQEYLTLDEQCVEHVGEVSYESLCAKRTVAATILANNARLQLHIRKSIRFGVYSN
jgi:hypothetical protein